MSAYHTSVLLSEVIRGLDVKAGKRYIDATFGGGGHTQAILDLGAEVLAIDADSDAIEEGKKLQGPRLRIVQGNFRDIEAIAKEQGFENVDGVLFDLGVSSHQINIKNRGFSFRFDDAPLDMRFLQVNTESAEGLIARSTENELYEIFAKYGEEERARTIAVHLIHARQVGQITTSGQLRKVIESVVGTGKASTGTVARVFQAIRIAVNDEMGALEEGLTGASHLVAFRGRIAVISFHSLEDRIVKRFFRRSEFIEISKKPITASAEEEQSNPRARSAKLRIVQKR
ncbi:MAG: 16S rRNA (cytosine(1402)-N(4))-methyltransferase RsmH [Candidatus Gottesmanbacteria bacterium]